MNNILKIYLLGLFVLINTSMFAQQREKKIVQFAGVVVSADNKEPVPFAQVLIKSGKRGVLADLHGFFTLVVHESDTIIFRAVGYKRTFYFIPDYINSENIAVVQLMIRDTILLPVTQIYPWPSKESFKNAFVNLKVKDDDYEIAMKNLAREQLKDIIRNDKAAGTDFDRFRMDGSMNYRYYVDQQISKLYYSGQYPPNNLLNPLAWAQFIKALQNGDLKVNQ